MVLAIGRGVPRRFDIPGNTDGIAYRLTDAKLYVGEPACVIGGGTSAAEAVIAISAAKAAAGNPTSVYWSYRGDKMPRVSKALAEVFFEAYVGNGNIRYHPQSNPAAVVTGDDKRDFTSPCASIAARVAPGVPRRRRTSSFRRSAASRASARTSRRGSSAALGIPHRDRGRAEPEEAGWW